MRSCYYWELSIKDARRTSLLQVIFTFAIAYVASVIVPCEELFPHSGHESKTSLSRPTTPCFVDFFALAPI